MAAAAATSIHTLHLTNITTHPPPFKSLTQTPLQNFYPKQLNQTYNHQRLSTTTIRSYKVVIEHDGKSTELDVEPDETLLSKALDSGLDVPYDCNLGVCMTCPAKLIEGKVDQSDGMLSDDVIERGYALMCAAYPRSDCRVRIIPEEELLSLQLATADD